MDTKLVRCPACEGKGEYDTESTWGKENIIYPVKCTYCDGTGKVSRSQTYTGIRKH